ncbi:MAG: phosphomannomutase/phosphoglucomutase [Gammaproteobacteria bacterium]
MVEGPVSKRRFSRRAVRQALLIGAGVVIGLLILAGVWMLLQGSQESKQQAEEQGLQTRANELAGSVSGTFSGIRKELSGLAAEPDVVELFEQGDAVELAGRAHDFRDRFPAALNLRFLLPGTYTLDNSSEPPVSYACLDMLKKAENSSGTIGAEVHLFGGPKQHIVLVERVRNQANELLGLVHLSLDAALFDQAVGGLGLTQDYVELRQSSSGRNLVLAEHGNKPRKDNNPVIASIPDSRWNLAYWSGSGPAPESSDTGAGSGLLLPGAVVLLLLLAAGAVLYRRYKPGGHTDEAAEGSESVVYAGAVKNIMDGAHPGMESLVPDLPGGGKSGNAQARPSEALSGSDDITMIMDKEELEKQQENTGETPQKPEQPTDEAPASKEAVPEEDTVEIDAGIFRAYDIRGIVGKNLTPEVVTLIGRAVASDAQALGEQTIVVGRDGRKSGPELMEALIKGLRGAGCNVIDIGEVPTPVLYYATHTLDAKSGIMLTGSHNGPEYNGLKIVIGGETLSEDALRRIYQRIIDRDLAEGSGSLDTAEVTADYIRRISEDIPVALGSSYKLVVDCGNGVAGAVAPQLYRALGHDVIELYCEVDGSFPNHHPDPSQPENLQALVDKVREEGADLGFAFDGDGDRLGVVDGGGNIIWPDRQLMALAGDVLGRNAGASIIFDVKCSRHLKDAIEAAGGKPLMWKTGHSLIKAKMKEIDAPLAGEMSGHIFFKERWYGFDDALYTGARLLEVLVNNKADPTEFFAGIPEGISTPELRIELAEDRHREFMQALEEKMDFGDAEVIKVDGLRVEFQDGWGLIRPSNTSPYLVLRFEADDEQALERIKGAFRDQIRSIDPDLTTPF